MPEERPLAGRRIAEVLATSTGGVGTHLRSLLAPLGRTLPLTVTQEQVTYYATPNLRDFSPARFPVFMWHGAHNFYGFPVYGEVATKLGQHMGGHEVSAQTRDFTPDPVPTALPSSYTRRIRRASFLGQVRSADCQKK